MNFVYLNGPEMNVSEPFRYTKFIFCRVPTAPGKPEKMMKAFPVIEISWNFEILQNIMENEKKPGKMRISVHSSQQVFSLQNVIFFSDDMSIENNMY